QPALAILIAVRATMKARRRSTSIKVPWFAASQVPSTHNDALMDNVCHTLVGAAFGESGLKRRTAFGNATLMISANIPDIDVFVFATRTPSVAFRRGWTHGVLAQALLPIALTGVMWLIARRWRPLAGPPVRIGWLLAL